LFAAASQAGIRLHRQRPKTTSKYIIGVDSDQYSYYAKSDPIKASYIVTSVLKRVDLALYNACSSFLAGTLTYGDLEVLGVAQQMVGLVDNDNYRSVVSPEDRAYLATITQGITDGTTKIASGLKRYTSSDTINALYDSLDPTKQ